MSAYTLAYDAAEEMLTHSSDVDVDREIAARSFREYVELAWPHVEPSVPFQPNFHVDAICDHLTAVKSGEIDRLVINVPPGESKSLLSSVMFPSWLWTDWPGAKVISASYGEDIAKRDSLRTRNLLESQWWRMRWGHQMTPNRSQWAAAHFRNKEGGLRLAVGVAGSVTGEHANVQIVDDPLKPLEVTGKMHVSKEALSKCDTWWDQTMPTRLVDKAVARVAARVIIMQRLHEGDLAGRMLLDHGYVHLCLPMEYEPKYAPGSFARYPELVGTDEAPRDCPIKACVAQHREHLAVDDEGNAALVDPRTAKGELLDPVRKPAAAVATLRRELGSRGAAAQLDQTPSPAEGAIFKRHQIRYYRRAELPTLNKQIQSWDMTFKEAGSSFVVGQVWGQAGADNYLLDQVRDKWGFSGTVAAVKALTIKWPKAREKLVEAKANGNAVVDHLKSEISGFVLVEPEGGKEARANAVEPQFESGNVWLPHKDDCPWVVEYVEELLGFPAVINDDQVDTTTQALVRLYNNALQRLRAAMNSKAARQLGR